MQGIANAANISKKTLYEIYPDKTAVFLAVLREQDTDPIFTPLEDGQSARDALISSMTQVVSFIFRPRQLALTRIAISEGDPELSRALETHIDGSYRTFLARMIEMADQGLLGRDAANRYADLMLGAALGSWHLRALAGGREEPRNSLINDRICDIVDTFAARLQLDAAPD
ncbi:TetR/AcrR family transcriptional regulator [Rhizobium sp.]|uniref:TetR/AcrR family transcriptional regulator n=1 Tax=Rhizobium sp. TaxID=391 RepID=UPI0034C5E63F